MRVFFDSSAFAKRYINEAATAQVIRLCDDADELVLAAIAIPELISAFCHLQREGRLSGQQYQVVKRDLLADIEDVIICDITPLVIRHAVTALEGHPLRGMDAIHIGAALAVGAQAFVSADARQCVAADALGLSVVAL